MRHLALLLFVLLFVSCGEELIDPPENLIPKAKMTEILYDLSLMDAIESNYPRALERNDILVMELIYEKYGIDSTQFVQSDLYYASKPDQYEEIYQALHDRLNKERDSITEAMQEKQAPAEAGEGKTPEGDGKSPKGDGKSPDGKAERKATPTKPAQ